jgi:hypothetical protein
MQPMAPKTVFLVKKRDVNMKKFWFGMICGITLCFSTAALASKAIQGILYPSKITIHNGTQVKELSTTNGTVVINYKNQTYIPLRIFSESTGSIVNFQPASKANSGDLNEIEVFSQSSLTGLNINSNEDYVTVGNLSTDDKDKEVIRGGTIKINKDISGKQIVMEAVGPDGAVRGTSEYFYIDKENIDPSKPGDVRSFKTLLAFSHDSDVTYRIKVQNFVNVKSDPMLDLNQLDLTHPLFGVMVPPAGPGDGYRIVDQAIMPFSFTLTNTSTDSIVLDEVPLSLIVYKSNPDGTNRKMVTQYKLRPLKGKLASREGFELHIPWYMKDKNGSVKPGDYVISLVLPKQIQFLNESTGKKQAWDVKLRYGTDFSITMK